METMNHAIEVLEKELIKLNDNIAYWGKRKGNTEAHFYYETAEKKAEQVRKAILKLYQS
jgi:hypothetical protein